MDSDTDEPDSSENACTHEQFDQPATQLVSLGLTIITASSSLLQHLTQPFTSAPRPPLSAALSWRLGPPCHMVF
jgi:hypothetical protein